MKFIGYSLGLVIGIAYLMNPTAGVFELLPDNLPIIGNLDEAAAVMLVIKSFNFLKESRNKEIDQ